MEELIAILIQFLIEVVGSALASVPFDCTCRVRRKPEDHPYGFAFLFLVIGGMVGWMSFVFIPPLIAAAYLRLASLLVSPLIAGLFGYYIALWQSRARNPLLVPRYHFWYAFSFTLGLAAVRFAYSGRAAA